VGRARWGLPVIPAVEILTLTPVPVKLARPHLKTGGELWGWGGEVTASARDPAVHPQHPKTKPQTKSLFPKAESSPSVPGGHYDDLSPHPPQEEGGCSRVN
jgi:hypothetical protein